VTPAASSRPAAAAETPEEVARDIFSDVAQGAFLDARMSSRDIGRWCEEAVEVIAAALRAERERGAQWLPIETAPRDGRYALVWREPWEAGYVACLHPGPVLTVTGVVNPTHWSPMPTPPAQDGGSETQEPSP
jgi:hypothetical protein